MPETVADDWNGRWGRLSAWMRGNPAYRYRQRLIWSALDLPPPPAPVDFLDIGCGDGSFAEALAARRPGTAIAGIEGSNEGTAMAAARVPGGTFLRDDLTQPTAETAARFADWASHALCSEVIEHVDEPVALLRVARAMIRPGGVMVVTVPAGPMSDFDRHVGHRKHYTADLLRRELDAAGFRVERLWRAGFPFHSLYRMMVLLRGEATVGDSEGEIGGLAASVSAVAFAGFNALFAANLPDSPFGWQIVARVRPD
jgi:SAM-dependent methyltransferase